MRLPIVLLLASTAVEARSTSTKATWFVDANAFSPGSGTRDDPYASIQYALSRPSTVDGDTVLVLPGTYPELVDFLGKDVVLASTDGPGVTTIDATLQFSVEQSAVKLRNGEGPRCTLSGFTIRGGEGTQVVEPVSGLTLFAGGGILAIGSAPTIRDCILVGNFADVGGGIYAENALLTLERCTIEENEARYFGGGIYLHESKVKLSRVTIRANFTINNRGGGIHAFGGNLDVAESVLDGNSGAAGGGNVALGQGAFLTMTGVVVRSGFTLDGDGGGVLADSSTLRLERCSFARNTAGDPSSNREGGALHVSNGDLEIRESIFTRNASARGGAVFLSGSTTSIGSTLFAGNAINSGGNFFFAEGGALAASQSMTRISRCAFRDNTAVSASFTPFGPVARGGAVWCDSAGLEIRSCLFEGNHAFYFGVPDPTLSKPEPGAQGGAVFGPALVTRSRFLANRATSRPEALIGRAEGGAVFGATVVSHSSFVANEVRGIGPVPDIGPAAESAKLECCTFEANLPLALPPLGPNCIELPCD